MKKNNVLIYLMTILTVVVIFSSIITGCGSGKNLVGQKSGAQLWGENCVRCHSIPAPDFYNDTDWETIGLHMRVRANMTEQEQVKIVEFLQSAN